MTLAKLETVTDYVTKLHGYAYFRPQDGVLRERLREAVLDAVEGELAEELGEGEFDLEVSIGRPEAESELTLTVSVDRPGVLFSTQLALERLGDEELQDLAGYLEPLTAGSAEAEAAPAGGNIVRKGVDDAEHHEKSAAAARLKVTPEWLKSVIPCTDYSYEEIDGKKYIREYFWSKDLIERLFKIKSTKTTPEDLQYVAKECCDGDMDWAKDLIARLKSPNRPEPAPKEQPPKGQGKQPQGRPGQQRGQQQGKPQQNRPAQGGNAPAKPSQPKPAQPGAGQGAAAPAGGAPAGGAPAEGNRERSRRSRHRKFRSQKDGQKKQEPAGEPK